MFFEKGIAEGVLITAMCALTVALGYLTANKVDKIERLQEKH